MWFGITYLTDEDTGDGEQVIVSVWDGTRPFRVGGAARSVADIICALRQAAAGSTAMPRCDGCGDRLDLPDLDAVRPAAA